MKHCRFWRFLAVGICTGFLVQAFAQTLSTQVQVIPPPIHRADAPSPNATAEELEKQGDALRVDKAFLDAIDYYQAALKKNPTSAPVWNKLGMAQLGLIRSKDAKKSFEAAVRQDRSYADAWNNLGVAYYELADHGKAIKNYKKAIQLRPEMASYYSNLGSAYFARKEFPKAMEAFGKALQLDPEVFEHSSRFGVSAQLPSPQDRARYYYLLAKMYAGAGVTERSLEYLRKAMEEGYRDINQVYKDGEFVQLRKDPRFNALMTNRPVAIPE